jgi:hypothetical protein
VANSEQQPGRVVATGDHSLPNHLWRRSLASEGRGKKLDAEYLSVTGVPPHDTCKPWRVGVLEVRERRNVANRASSNRHGVRTGG